MDSDDELIDPYTTEDEDKDADVAHEAPVDTNDSPSEDDSDAKDDQDYPNEPESEEKVVETSLKDVKTFGDDEDVYACSALVYVIEKGGGVLCLLLLLCRTCS